MSLSPGALLRWAALEEARRRRAAAGPARLPLALRAALVGAALAAWASPTRVLLAAAALALVVLCGAPFRLFWRRDAALLARLPLPGRSLIALALVRSLAAAGAMLLALAPSIAVLAARGVDPLRPALAGLVLAGLAALLGPAAALAAGAIVASDKARAALASVAGELSAPGTAWLGALPAFAGAAVALLAIDLAGWVAGGVPEVGDAAVLLGGAAAVAALAGAWCLLAADAVMPAALREVAALDTERLAHVDRSTASPLERAWARLSLSGGAALVFDKDARLARRRHPSPYALGPLGVVVCWLLALGGEAAAGWSLAVIAGLGAYAALMARRALVPPLELPRLTASLPLAAAALSRARLAAAALRAATWVLPAAAPILARGPEPAALAWIGAALVAAPLATATSWGAATRS